MVFIKLLSGRTIYITTDEDTPVEALRAYISRKEQIPSHLFSLIYGVHVLTLEGILQDYNIQDTSTIFVNGRLLSCMNCNIVKKRKRWF